MAFTTHQEFRQRMAQYGAIHPWANKEGSASVTGVTVGVPTTIYFNDLGTTVPGTLEGLAGMDTTSWSYATVSEKVMSFIGMMQTDVTGAISMGWLYEIGTVDLNGTGDKFTHHSATFPVRRTVMGATADVPLIPMMYCTAAANGSGTAYTLKTAAGGTGYKDEAGNNVVGTRSTSISAIAAQTSWMSAVEAGDCSVTDVVAVQITAGTSTAGSLTVFGYEPMIWTPGIQAKIAGFTDVAFGQMGMQDFRPAAATSGTVNGYFVAVVKNTPPNARACGFFGGSPNV